MKDILKELEDFVSSTKEFEDRIYSFSEILKDFEQCTHLVVNGLHEKLNTNPHGFCFPILVQDSTELHLYTLIEVSMLDSYTQVIPDNKFQYACDLKKTNTSRIKETIVISAMSKKIHVEVDLYKTSFSKSNVTAIQFPDDYFLKGIPLLSELLSKQFIVGDTTSAKEAPYMNQNFASIKKLTLSKIMICLMTLSLLLSCSTTEKVKPIVQKRINTQEQNEVERYEQLLKTLRIAEYDIRSNNPFAALLRLQSIKEEASYHGVFRNLYSTALNATIQLTNEIPPTGENCQLIRERVLFFYKYLSDNLNKIQKNKEACKISFVEFNNNPPKAVPTPHLANFELNRKDLFGEVLRSNFTATQLPLEEMLLIDLKILAAYHFKIKNFKMNKDILKPELARFTLPVNIEFNSDRGENFCAKYGSILHDSDYTQTIPCYDFQSSSGMETSHELKISSILKEKIGHRIPVTSFKTNYLKLIISYEDRPQEQYSLSTSNSLIFGLQLTQGNKNLNGRTGIFKATDATGNFDLALKISHPHSFYFDLQMPIEKVNRIKSIAIQIDTQKMRNEVLAH